MKPHLYLSHSGELCTCECGTASLDGKQMRSDVNQAQMLRKCPRQEKMSSSPRRDLNSTQTRNLLYITHITAYIHAATA